MSTNLLNFTAQRFIISKLFKPLSMVCIAIAARRMPTTRDITVEIVKLINFDPQAAVYRRIAERNTARNIEKIFKNKASTL
jgi:hypothetical protein